MDDPDTNTTVLSENQMHSDVESEEGAVVKKKKKNSYFQLLLIIFET